MTTHEIAVLEHTSQNGRYVTDEDAVCQMAKRGLLHYHGGASFWPKGTRGYTMAPRGRAMLREYYANLCRFPQPKPKRNTSEAFEKWRAYCEAFGDISFSQFWKEIWPTRRYF